MANPNPSPATRFQKGVSGNPSGRSSEEQSAHLEAAKIAAALKLKALSCLQEKVSGTGEDKIDDNQLLAMLMNADALRLFKEVEDRAHGTPKQSVDVESPQGTMTPTVVTLQAVAAKNDNSGD